ncbi:MAG: glycosyltransferase [Kofleriaceae bacterium]|nr:glycosyltransferase [Kofleriaceae bacterium]
MRRVLFISAPNTRGDIEPLAHVADWLKLRGHTIAWTALPFALQEPLVTRLVPIVDEFLPTPEIDWPAAWRGEALAAMFADAERSTEVARAFVDATVALVPPLRKLLAAQRPDLVLGDSQNMASLVACELERIPFVGLCGGLQMLTPGFFRGHHDERAREVLAGFGVQAELRGGAALSRFANLAFTTAAYVGDGAGEDRAKPMSLVGPSRPRIAPVETVAFPWERLARDRPIVYAAFGSVVAAGTYTYEVVARAAAELGAQLVLSGRLSPAEVEALPGDVIAMERVPQMALLERVDAFVSHGGASSVAESLYAGKPLVIVPFYADQFVQAHYVEASGAGVAIARPSFTPDTCKDALARVLRPGSTYAQSATRIRASYRANDGARRAADIVERILAGGRAQDVEAASVAVADAAPQPSASPELTAEQRALIVARLRHRPRRSEPKMVTAPVERARTASVIIPVRNRPGVLDVLDALARQRSHEQLLEVIVVDLESTDDTRVVAASRRYPFELRWETRPFTAPFNRSRTRNWGIEAARGDVALFLDADVLAGPDLVREHLRAYSGEGWHATIGYVYGASMTDPWSRTPEALRPPPAAELVERVQALAADVPAWRDQRDSALAAWRGLERCPFPWNFWWTNNASCSLAALRDVGGFDETMGDRWGFEDIELGYRLARRGVTMSAVPTAWAAHYPHEVASTLEATARTNANYFVRRCRDPLVELVCWSFFSSLRTSDPLAPESHLRGQLLANIVGAPKPRPLDPAAAHALVDALRREHGARRIVWFGAAPGELAHAAEVTVEPALIGLFTGLDDRTYDVAVASSWSHLPLETLPHLTAELTRIARLAVVLVEDTRVTEVQDALRRQGADGGAVRVVSSGA